MQTQQNVNILLVDDHPENLLALEAILERLGQTLVKANSGEEALRCLLQQDFAVILLDVQMPGMDGFETAKLIRNRERSRYTPIIFLTAFNTSDTMVFKGYSLGAVDYLFKPLEPEILVSKVTVFVDLFRKTEEIKRQAAQLVAMNAELKKSEERFRSLSACSPVGIFLTDTEGYCTYTNPRCQSIFGFALEEKSLETWLESVHPDDRQRLLTDWSSWVHEIQEYSNEFRCQTQDGNMRWVHLRSSPMLSDTGKLLGHVATVEDITDRKQAEEARTQFIREQAARQQAEATNRMKDEFLATLSHELRTPLNSVLGWVQLLRTRSFDQATTLRALETIERNAKSQAQLVEDILDVSRLIRGKLQLNRRSINLVTILEMAIESVRPTAEAKEIQLHVHLNPSVELNDSLSDSGEEMESAVEETGEAGSQVIPRSKRPGKLLLIEGDPNRLQQVVWNLLSNAIKFTPKGGTVNVQLECDRIHAQIRIQDTGIGISPEFLPHVFDRFRQEDGTTTRSYGGLGLGLSIVHHLVQLHNGSITAESEGEGKGATFTVTLPRPECSQSQPNLANPTEFNANSDRPSLNPSGLTLNLLSGLQVLVVDEQQEVQEFITTVIEESGAQVTVVESPLEAIQIIEQLKPDVLISDINLSLEDGNRLIRKIRDRESQHGGFLPAIALTPYTQDEELQRMLDSGFQLHLSKPVDTTKLVMAIAKLSKGTLTLL
ncbi:MAG TPA: response regulator [Coleofasciculaceae cyanobacterium]